uniref:methylthioribulose-1-phosphate dehydratase n=1 Tax=Myxine glutinosa TaxID=7769 RepID=UPI00358F1C1B
MEEEYPVGTVKTKEENERNVGQSLTNQNEDQMTPPQVLSYLCRHLYSLGWMPGSGGAISTREGDTLYVTPSGVQKERVKASDVFELRADGTVLSGPSNLRPSQCLPLFQLIYEVHGPGTIIHSHSMAVVMATILYPGHWLRISHLHMIKGVPRQDTGGRRRWDEELCIPVIENEAEDKNLAGRLRVALCAQPDCPAVLIRRHGAYIWGESWDKAKTTAESIDYLCDIAVRMKQSGLSSEVPPSGEKGFE